MLEGNFFNSMIKANGNFIVFFERPIAGVLGVVTIGIWIAMIYFMRRGNMRRTGRCGRAMTSCVKPPRSGF